MSLRNIGMTRRPFGDPVAPEPKNERYVTPPTSDINDLNLPLYAIAAHADERVRKHKKLVFHINGDTGGLASRHVQEAISEAMEAQLKPNDEADIPSFFYHLGDVVYYNGLPWHYDEQFYEPYEKYVAPIVAIPGNHDGQVSVQKGDEPDPVPTLTGFMKNFCAQHSTYGGFNRDTMTQPYVWWTFETAVATFIGLYSNVEGNLDGRGKFEQQNFLHNELRRAPKDRALFITVHHPPYSLDAKHGGSPAILAALDRAIEETKRVPDAVFSGHVHSYQRFTRRFRGNEVPFIVAGARGYATSQGALHKLQHGRDGRLKLPFKTVREDVELANYCDDHPGFLRVTVDEKTIKGEYFTVPFNGGFADHSLFDSFSIDRNTHKISSRK